MKAHSALAEIGKTASHESVYEPSDDSFLLADALTKHILEGHCRPNICVEIGCGSGYVICSIARLLAAAGLHCHCIAVDVNPCATECSSRTLQAHQISSVDLVRCNLLDPMYCQLDGKVDLLVFNPPYVPTPDEEVERKGIAQAWAGGYKGRAVTDLVLPKISSLLCKEGHCFIVAVAENDPQDMLQRMACMNLQGSIVAERQADEENLFILEFIKDSAIL